MPCYHPIPAERDGRNVVLHPKSAGTTVGRGKWSDSANMSLPCGSCVGCKITRSQEWASRCVHELREHHSAIFATLTYEDKYLPADGSLVPAHLRDFLKRLRREVELERPWVFVNPPGSLYHRKLRFMACGEYGDLRGRPHYHAILFGVSFPDAQRVTSSLYNSAQLERTWRYGNVNFGEVTRASAAYVAGYTAKSLGRYHADDDGVALEPPFLRVSKGLGSAFVDRHAEDLRSGSLVVDGVPHKIPRYYMKRLAEVRPDVLQEAQYNSQLRERGDSQWSDRLAAGEVIAKRKRELTRRHSL